MSSSSSGFVSTGTSPLRGLSNMVMINPNEFIAAGQSKLGIFGRIDDDDNDDNGIFIYNIKSNEWKLFIKYPKEFTTTCHSICYNPNTKILYLYGDQSNMININIDTKEFKMVKSDLQYVGNGPVLLNIHNKCHIIAGSDSTHHLIWDDIKQQFETIHTFPKWHRGLHGHGVVYAASKNTLYLFGGYDYGNDYIENLIWKCELHKNNKWSVLKVGLPFLWYYCGYILSSDERYILLFDSTKTIYILDVNEEKLYQSKMKGVEADYAILCGDPCDEILVCGYIKCISELLNIMIPTELIRIFQQYYSSEMVYLIKHNAASCNYKIHFQDIINAEKSIVNEEVINFYRT